jgi:hypothetical protein
MLTAPRFLGTGTAGVTNGAKATADLNGPIACAYDNNNNLYWVEQVGRLSVSMGEGLLRRLRLLWQRCPATQGCVGHHVHHV